jgi:hypothetical protein
MNKVVILIIVTVIIAVISCAIIINNNGSNTIAPENSISNQTSVENNTNEPESTISNQASGVVNNTEVIPTTNPNQEENDKKIKELDNSMTSKYLSDSNLNTNEKIDKIRNIKMPDEEIKETISIISNSSKIQKRVTSSYNGNEFLQLFCAKDDSKFVSDNDEELTLFADYTEVYSGYAIINKEFSKAKYKVDYFEAADIHESDIELVFDQSLQGGVTQYNSSYILTENGDMYVHNVKESTNLDLYNASCPTVIEFTKLESPKKIEKYQSNMCLFDDGTIGIIEKKTITPCDEKIFLDKMVYRSLGDYIYYIVSEDTKNSLEGMNISNINCIVFGDNSEGGSNNLVGFLSYKDNNGNNESEVIKVANVDENNCEIQVKDSKIISKINYYIAQRELDKYIILEATLVNGKTVYFKNQVTVDDYFALAVDPLGWVEDDIMDWNERGGKPIIYLYPEKDTNVKVELPYADKIIYSYPDYNNSWNVIAKPNGDLLDVDTNKKLYALYYENINTYDFNVEDEGFVIKGNEIVEFLEEKLSILGLNDREKEEFIIYWLPRLYNKNYLYIRFGTQHEIAENMPLNITPEPDTLIRVWMTIKELNNPITVKEQRLRPVTERKGFTAVEWGVVEMN